MHTKLGIRSRITWSLNMESAMPFNWFEIHVRQLHRNRHISRKEDWKSMNPMWFTRIRNIENECTFELSSNNKNDRGIARDFPLFAKSIPNIRYKWRSNKPRGMPNACVIWILSKSECMHVWWERNILVRRRLGEHAFSFKDQNRATLPTRHKMNTNGLYKRLPVEYCIYKNTNSLIEKHVLNVNISPFSETTVLRARDYYRSVSNATCVSHR